MSSLYSCGLFILLASFPAVWLHLSTAIVVIFCGWCLILNLSNIPDLNFVPVVVTSEIPSLPRYKRQSLPLLSQIFLKWDLWFCLLCI